MPFGLLAVALIYAGQVLGHRDFGFGQRKAALEAHRLLGTFVVIPVHIGGG